jgi:hypothetical protein
MSIRTTLIGLSQKKASVLPFDCIITRTVDSLLVQAGPAEIHQLARCVLQSSTTGKSGRFFFSMVFS